MDEAREYVQRNLERAPFPFNEELFVEVFQMTDTNNSGTISKTELAGLLGNLLEKLTGSLDLFTYT